jgi:hypothetical protein
MHASQLNLNKKLQTPLKKAKMNFTYDITCVNLSYVSLPEDLLAP